MSTAQETWTKAILSSDANLQDAISNLEDVGIKLIMVADTDRKLLGTICDGDIRRGLLKGLDFQSPVEMVMNKNALVVPPEMDSEMVLQLMVANKIQQIPIIDKQEHIVGLHLWDDLSAPERRDSYMLIMAGGKGERLSPHTNDCPKPMLKVANKPILEHIIERAKNEGFSNFILAIHYLGEVIEEYFGNGKKLGVNIEYLREDSPLGTAGALSLVNPLPTAPIVVTNGDVITDISYGGLLDFHMRLQAAATMAVRVYEWQHSFGVVETDGLEITGFDEKPVSKSYINAGVYALDPACLELIGENEVCDMPDLFRRVKEAKRKVLAYPMHEPWLDVGRPEDLESIRKTKS